jgi:2-polyprenyl-3-methyl-5-hydroxy-6-metoxy-1,4-benzoquinol methylase
MYNHAKNVMGLDVEQTTFDVWKQDKKYGLIYLSHVLDDLPNINQVIEKITEYLEPNGILFIEVPNFSWSFRMNFEKKEDLYINKYFFSIASLTSLLTNNNFKILNTKTFQLVHRNTFFQKLISPIMFLMKLKPKKYRPYLRIISRKNV